jgi:hypothetical protein
MTRLAFFAFVVVIKEIARRTGNLDTAIAVSSEAGSANQGTNSRRFELDRVKRIGARCFGVELGAGVPVE